MMMLLWSPWLLGQLVVLGGAGVKEAVELRVIHQLKLFVRPV